MSNVSHDVCKKKRFSASLCILSVLCVLLAVLLSCALALPSFVESRVNSILAGFVTNGAADMEIRSIGLSRANVSCSLKDSSGGRIGALGSVTLEYSVWGLLSGRLKSVRIENADMLVKFDSERMAFSFPVYDLLRDRLADGAKSQREESKSGSAQEESPAFTVDKASVSGSLVILSRDGDMTFIPYSFSAVCDPEKGMKLVNYNASCAFSTNRVSLKGVFDAAAEKLTCDVSVKFSTSALPRDIRTNVLPRAFRSSAELGGSFVFSFVDGRIVPVGGMEAKLHTAYRAGTLKSASDSKIKASASSDGVELTFDTLNANVSGIDVSVKDIVLKADSALSAARCSFILSAADSARFDAVVTMDRDASVKNSPFKFVFSVSSRGEPSLDWGGALFGASAFTVDGECIFSSSGVPRWTGRLLASDVKTVNSSASVSVKTLSGFFSGEGGASADIRFAGSGIFAESAGCAARAETVSLDGVYSSGKFSFALKTPSASVAAERFKTVLKDISFDLPFVYPAPESDAPEGFFKVGRMLYDSRRAGSFDSSIRFEKDVFTLDGKLSMFANHANVLASFSPFSPHGLSASAVIDVPKQPLTVTKELKEMVPQFKDLRLEGFAQMTCGYNYSSAVGHSGSLSFGLEDVSFSMPELKLSGGGVNLSFTIPRLTEMVSDPERRLEFASLDFDKMSFKDGNIRFRMESPTSWRLENAAVSWCGGRVRTSDVSFAAGRKDYSLTLYCDRLVLADLLTQTGVGSLSGEGRVSGTLPITFSETSFKFDDAFLYSTPGETGVLKGVLSDAVSGSDGASVELSIAKEALRDFSYSWVKLGVNSDPSVPENLKLTLQLDGRPRNDLYFRYNEKSGIFEPSDVPCRFQGIRLDVNINLRLDKTMKLVDYINTLLNPERN